jgi:putative thioredoxin
MNYEITDFQTDVIERSLTTPVLVDFWAEWCRPCKILGPILERLAAKSDGQWVLAKVDTDRHQELAVEYGVRGIPNVKLFVDGKVANEFTGALPESAVVQWLKKALPGKSGKEIERAEKLLQDGRVAEGQSLLKTIIEHDSGNERARVLLAGSFIASDPDKAASLVADIEEHSEHFPMVDAIRTLGSLASKLLHPEKLPDEPSKTTYLGALKELAAFDYDAALERFIEVIRTNRYYDDDGARKACIAIFKTLGDDHEVTRRRRREFSSALYT